MSEYLTTSYRPDCDWVEGEIRERNIGEGAHSIVQSFLIVLFHQFRVEWGVRVHPEQRVQTSASHYRVPDVCVVRAEEPLERIIRKPPLLCIEILSSKDRMTEMQERVDDYLAMGVGVVWVVDPRRKKGFVADARGTRGVEELSVAGTAIRVAVSAVFAELEELERQQR